VAQQNSASYMTNLNKINLINDWNQEANTKTALDAAASAAGVSSTAYDNAVLNLSTQLIVAGAPSNWASIWPDGTTSGPWTNVMMSLAALWATIATARANLVNGIKAAGDAATYSTAISAAATDATTKALASTLASQLHQVAWASSALPGLPNGSYPAGYLAQTTDNRKFQVNSGGTAWGEILQGAVGIFGQLVAAQLTVANFDNLIPNPGGQITSPPVGSWEASALINWGALYPAIIGTVLTPTGYGRVIDGNTYARIQQITCNPGDVFYAQCQCANLATGAGSRLLGLSFFNAAGGSVGDYYSTQPVSTYSFTSPQTLSIRQAAPAGSAYVMPFIQSIGWAGSSAAMFNNFYMRRCMDASVVVDGCLTAQQANVNMVMTSNFATDAGNTSANLTGTSTIPSGNPTAGFWAGVGTNNPILVGPGGMLVGIPIYGGSYTSLAVDAAGVMAYSAIRTNYSASSPPQYSRFWYGGNVDQSTIGGAPSINRLTVTPTVYDTSNHIVWMDLAIAPSAKSDNLDAMQYATIQFYRQSAAGTTGTLTSVGPLFKVPLADRLYKTPGTDGDAGNVSTITASAAHSGFNGGVPACIVTLYNSFGPSAGACFYAASGWSAGTSLTNNGASFPSGLTGGGSGGGGGGGGGLGCVPAGTPILMANGLSIPVEWITEGMEVATYDDLTLEPVSAKVAKVYRYEKRDLWRITTSMGSLVCSHDHRIFNGTNWPPVRQFKAGDRTLWHKDGRLESVEVLSCEPTGDSKDVYHMTLTHGHVYIAGWIAAHNMYKPP